MSAGPAASRFSGQHKPNFENLRRTILRQAAPSGTGGRGQRQRLLPGTGNSVANYIPVQNYLAMLDQGRRWNREHFDVA